MPASPPRYVLTVDVEDYFQVEAFADRVSRESWDEWPSRVVANTERVLDLLDRRQARATFFFLGWVAAKFPALVRQVHGRGHELACHSYWHRPVSKLTPEEFRQDLRLARQAIEQAGGTRVLGYRAPTWSITREAAWALDILAEDGFAYDSSIYPIRHDLYGDPGAPRFPHTLSKLTEFPPVTLRAFGTNFPAARGGYLRILPQWYTHLALRQYARADGRAVVVYFHPWELDP